MAMQVSGTIGWSVRGWIAGAALAGVLTGGCATKSGPAKPTPQPPRVTKVSPEARAVIDRMAAFLAGKKGFAFRQSSVTTAADSDLASKLGGTKEHTVLVERPNRLRIDLVGDDKGAGTAVCDGTTFVVHHAATNRYESVEAPAGLADMAGHTVVGAMLSNGGAEPVNRVFFAADPAATFVEGLGEVSVVGTEKIGDRECVRLTVTSENGDWDVWIATGDEPVPLQFVPKLSPMQWGGKIIDVANTVSFDDWRFDPSFAPEEFAFTLPEGAEEVESIIDSASGERRRKEGGRQPIHSTVGFPAPAVTLVGADGSRFNPAAEKDKVVVLDFWATWCGPCRVSLPEVARVCAEYADKGVVFRAVNLKEDGETIKKFLEEEPLEAPIVMDADGAAGAAYRVEAIPHTVVIGKDGLVQAVNVGAGEGLEAKLRKQLDAVLEGKSLVPRTGNMIRAEPF